jgi:hypothetical protein
MGEASSSTRMELPADDRAAPEMGGSFRPCTKRPHLSLTDHMMRGMGLSVRLHLPASASGRWPWRGAAELL